MARANFFILILLLICLFSNQLSNEEEITLIEISLRIRNRFIQNLEFLNNKILKIHNKTLHIDFGQLKSITSFRNKLIFFRNSRLEETDDLIRSSIIISDNSLLSEIIKKIKINYEIVEYKDNIRLNKRFKAVLIKLADRFAEKLFGFPILIELQIHFSLQLYQIMGLTHNFFRSLKNLSILSNDSFQNLLLNRVDVENNFHPLFILSKKNLNNLSNKEILIESTLYYYEKNIKEIENNEKLAYFRYYLDEIKQNLVQYKNNLNKNNENHLQLYNFLQKFLTSIYSI